jgi:hypothetical protein
VWRLYTTGIVVGVGSRGMEAGVGGMSVNAQGYFFDGGGGGVQ